MNKGQYYEEHAVDYLLKAGLKLLERNFRCKAGEIDIICSQGQQLVFVEVRYRSNRNFGSAAASVDRNKQRKIIRAAQFYLQSRPRFHDRPCRFDVLAITPIQSTAEVELQWLKSAFIG
ncbi:MAG: YraN family protein [Gammaproteobacteria bacterium]|nr:YraN family protein [Gammaproteobacteria bacterium]